MTSPIAGAVPALDYIGEWRILTDEELGEGFGAALQKKGYGASVPRDNLQADLDEIVATKKADGDNLIPDELIKDVQDSAASLWEHRDTKDYSLLTEILTGISMAITGIGAILTLFIPVLGGSIVIFGLVATAASQTWKFFRRQKYRRIHAKLREVHQKNLQRILEYKEKAAQLRREQKELQAKKLAEPKLDQEAMERIVMATQLILDKQRKKPEQDTTKN